jgi:hypothetical protein
MKSVKGFIEQLVVVIGVLLLFIYSFFQSSNLYFLPLIFFFISTIIIGIFEFREYQNLTLYRVGIFVVLAMMWITIYIQSLSQITSSVFYIESVLLTLAIIVLTIYLPSTKIKARKMN